MTASPGDDPARTPRPSIEERARRRAEMDAGERDRYDTLLRHLRAGREIQVERPRGLRAWLEEYDWHPIAGRLLLAIAIGVALYVIATAAVGWLRENRVDTWTGPDASVQSGQALPGCTALVRLNDEVLPNWIRYEGRVFGLIATALPMGSTNIGSAYVDTGYRLDDLALYEVRVEGVGELGSRLIVRNGDAPAGQLYRRLEGC